MRKEIVFILASLSLFATSGGADVTRGLLFKCDGVLKVDAVITSFRGVVSSHEPVNQSINCNNSSGPLQGKVYIYKDSNFVFEEDVTKVISIKGQADVEEITVNPSTTTASSWNTNFCLGPKPCNPCLMFMKDQETVERCPYQAVDETSLKVSDFEPKHVNGNKAFGKTVLASSLYCSTDYPQGVNPNRLTDGFSDGNWLHNSVAHTGTSYGKMIGDECSQGDSEEPAFFAVLLGAAMTVNTITVYNRTDYMPELIAGTGVYLVDAPINTSNPIQQIKIIRDAIQNASKLGSLTGMEKQTFTAPAPMQKYSAVVLYNPSGYLQVAEVVVE